jgi:uncharacterized protein involved in exopolysaccharide biosynthesis
MSADTTYPVTRAPIPTTIISELRPAEAKSHFALTIFKWYPLILTFSVVLTIVAAIAMLMKPIPPSATAKILIKTGSDALPISGLPVTSGRATPEFLQTEAEMFSSRLVLLPVVRALREQRGEPVVESELDTAVSALRADLVVSLIPNTTMLQTKKSAPTEAEAERLLRMIIDSYVEQHATAYSGGASFAAFFEREASAAATRLQEAENRLQQWREANNVVATEEQLAGQLTAVAEYEAGLRRTETDYEATRAQIDLLARDIAALPRETVTSREHMANPLIARLKADIATEEAALRGAPRNAVIDRLQLDIATAEEASRNGGANPAVIKLKGDLLTAELSLNDLRQRYHDEDRRVREKLEQIARLRQEIDTAERDGTTAAGERVQTLRQQLTAAERDAEAAARARIATLRTELAAAERERDVFGRETMGANPLRENLNRELASARARLTGLAAQRVGLRDQLRDARSGLGRLTDVRLQAERLGRDVELAKAVYLQNTKRLDDARLTVDLRKQQLANVAVIEPPRATPGSRNLKQVAVVALLGGVVGVGLGVATALALDFFNWSLRTPEDVEFYLGVPAVAAVPAISGPARYARPLPAFEEEDADGDVRHDRDPALRDGGPRP